MTTLGATGVDVFPLCLGGNVFTWTADERASVQVLDAYAAAGGNFIDTADVYTAFVSGHLGGESESVIGDWLAARGDRGDFVIATKVGFMPGRLGLGRANIRAAAEDSLRRLRTDYVDLYYAHLDDQDAPLEETLAEFDALVREGKVRYVGVSNITAERLAEALAISEREGFVRYTVVQPRYNLMERAGFEDGLAAVCLDGDVSCVPFLSLANGFLTGKYRVGGDEPDTPRAASARAYLEDPRGPAALAALDQVAAEHHTTVAAVALAWLAAQPTVAAPIASARNPEQLADLVAFVELRLTEPELELVSSATAN